VEKSPPQERFDRVQKLRHVYVLGVYLKRGGLYSWTTHLRGDGSGTPADTLRIVLEVDDSRYWRTWSEVARRKGRKP
jgi:hypothetical protein